MCLLGGLEREQGGVGQEVVEFPAGQQDRRGGELPAEEDPDRRPARAERGRDPEGQRVGDERAEADPAGGLCDRAAGDRGLVVTRERDGRGGGDRERDGDEREQEYRARPGSAPRRAQGAGGP